MGAMAMGVGPTVYRFRHYSRDRQGRRWLQWASGVGELDRALREGSLAEREVLEAQQIVSNALADEGEELMVGLTLRGTPTAPAGYFFRLYNDTPVDTDTLSTLANEVTGTGYAPIAVARNTTDWPTLALQSGDFRADSVTKTFTATGTWSAATILVLATSSDNTGRFFGWSALSATRTLVNGDDLDVSMNVSQA